MNVHSYDRDTLKILEDSTLECFEVGSKLYGLNNKDSDVDNLCIYARGSRQTETFLWEHHNIQFKLDGEDRIFTTLHNFIRNLMNGDSPINFELIHEDSLKDSSLEFLYNNRDWFYSYHVVKSYLGLAKRDLNVATKDSKRFSHAYRSYHTAKMIVEGEAYRNDLRGYRQDLFDTMYDLKNNLYIGDKMELISILQNDIKELRNTANTMLEKGQIVRFMDVYHMKCLDEWLYDYTQSDKYVSMCNNFDISFMYNILENGINY